MAEHKQYITQTQENGSIKISEDVIAALVAQTVREVDGVVSLNLKAGPDTGYVLPKKSWSKAIRIDIQEDDTLSIVCNLMIGYGQSLVNVAQSVQSAVVANVEAVTGLKVKSVNVNVCGIIRQ
jgi:uncharacterized alkaline shock family protein YloU